jgi:hypothetical protein
MPLFEMTVGQGLSTVKCMWFRGTYLKDKFKRGADGGAVWEAGAFADRSAGKFKMIQPQFELLPEPGGDGRGCGVFDAGGGADCAGVRVAGRDDGVGSEAGVEVAAAGDVECV